MMSKIVTLLWIPSFWSRLLFLFFFFNDTATTEIYTLSLYDALPISFFAALAALIMLAAAGLSLAWFHRVVRSEEQTSELQSHHELVCRLLLEKKKKEKMELLTKVQAKYKNLDVKMITY